MGDLVDMVLAASAMRDNYEERKVCRSLLGNDLIVSTAWSTDFGYETAVFDPGGGVYVIERHDDKATAEKAHAELCMALSCSPATVEAINYDGSTTTETVIYPDG